MSVVFSTPTRYRITDITLKKPEVIHCSGDKPFSTTATMERRRKKVLEQDIISSQSALCPLDFRFCKAH
jgi:hypothetical protein